MNLDYKNFLGFFFLVCGIVLIAGSAFNITGAVISEGVAEWTGSFLGIIFVIIGLVVLVSKELEEMLDEDYDEDYIPEKLYMYVHPEILKEGMSLRGWDNKDLCVCAFDPSQKDPGYIKKKFKFDYRVLVEIDPRFIKDFYPRATGPEKKYQGIYASKRALPKHAMIPIDLNERDLKYEENQRKDYSGKKFGLRDFNENYA